MTKLEAINLCLRGIGRMPASSVDEPDLDVGQALATIEAISKDIQSKGWYFNKEYNWNIIPDSSGEVYVPNNALEVIAWDCSRNADLALRGNRIYDKVNHSFDLSDYVLKDGSISFAFILEIPFEELPHAAATAIAYAARKQFAQDSEGDTQKWQFNNNDEEKAMVVLYSSETRNKKSNILNGAAGAHLANIQGTNSVFGLYGQVYPKRRTQ